jgi:hypothetical protein
MSTVLRAFVLLAAFIPAAAAAAPKAELWPRWQAHDDTSARRIDHGAWAAFLEKYLVAVADGPNRVRYGAVTPADRARLDGYIASLAATPVDALARAEQLPFWIDLYNALTVRVVLDHYPVEKILDIDISPGFFAVGPWGKKLIAIEGEALSLDDIEHRILRPIWRDARIHYALNCASLGCPDLQPQPFTRANTDAMLDAAARAYLASGRGIWFDRDGTLGASSIFKWYRADFGRDDREVIDYFKRYAPPALRARLDGARDIGVYYYDWMLNDAR